MVFISQSLLMQSLQVRSQVVNTLCIQKLNKYRVLINLIKNIFALNSAHGKNSYIMKKLLLGMRLSNNFIMFISQNKTSEKQNAQVQVKQNTFDKLQQNLAVIKSSSHQLAFFCIGLTNWTQKNFQTFKTKLYQYSVHKEYES